MRTVSGQAITGSPAGPVETRCWQGLTLTSHESNFWGKEPAANYADGAVRFYGQTVVSFIRVIRVIRGWFPEISGLMPWLVRNTG